MQVGLFFFALRTAVPDDELKNIEIEDQAAATIDDEETVEKVLRESAGTFSSDVADIQEASRENYRILGTIKE